MIWRMKLLMINILLDVRKVTALEQINVMLNELIGKVKTLKLQNVRQSIIHMLFKK